MLLRSIVLSILVACGGCCLFQKETGGNVPGKPVVSPENTSNATQGSGKPMLDPLEPWYNNFNIPIGNWEDSH